MKTLWNFILETVNLTTAWTCAKIFPWVSLAFVFLCNFFSPTAPVIFYIMALGVLDVFTGIWASLKEGKVITSEKFWKRKAGIVVLFLVGVICMLIIDKMLKETHENLPAFALNSWFIFYGLYETISVMENIARIGLLPGVPAFIAYLKSKLPAPVVQAVEEAKKEEEEKQ